MAKNAWYSNWQQKTTKDTTILRSEFRLVEARSAMWAAKFKCRRIHKCYETILCFPNLPLYEKKKNIYEKFRGPFEHAPGAPPLKSASDDPTPRQAIIDPMFNQRGNPRITTRRMISESTLDETVNRRRVERVGPLEVAGLNERLTIFNSSSGSSVRITFYQSLEQRRGGKPALTARLLRWMRSLLRSPYAHGARPSTARVVDS